MFLQDVNAWMSSSGALSFNYMKEPIKLVVLLCFALSSASLRAHNCDVWIGQTSEAVAANNAAPKTDKSGADKPAAADVQNSTPADYVIGPDDVLRVSVWKEPDVTETVPVRPDGKISMPLLGDVTAAGETPLQLGASIQQKLKKYIADPRVTVVVTAINSQHIFVSGEVSRPGAMALLPHMTVLQALSSAGFTQFAKLKGIYVLRDDGGKQVKLPFNYKSVIKGNHPEQNIVLKPGDTLVVP